MENTAINIKKPTRAEQTCEANTATLQSRFRILISKKITEIHQNILGFKVPNSRKK